MASMEVIDSPNSLDGDARSEEPITDGESLTTTSKPLGTESFVEGLSTIFSEDPLNVTESLANQTEHVDVKNETSLSDGNVTTLAPFTSLAEAHEANNTEIPAENVSMNTDPPAENTYIHNEQSNDTWMPEQYSTNWSSVDILSTTTLSNVYNGSTPIQFFSPPLLNGTDLHLRMLLKKRRGGLFRQAYANSLAYNDFDNVNLATPATPIATTKTTTAKPKITTTKRTGFRSKTVLKKPPVKSTRKPVVRKVTKRIGKATTKKAVAGFRSGRKVRTVVKRRFRKFGRRRAATTRLVSKRRLRTTRLVRKTTIAPMAATVGDTGKD